MFLINMDPFVTHQNFGQNEPYLFRGLCCVYRMETRGSTLIDPNFRCPHLIGDHSEKYCSIVNSI
jgi:hypothetical protein